MKNPFLRTFICICAALLMACALLTAAVDPFFHYHAPLRGFPYVVDNEQTQNPGMAWHLNYDSVITGSSMTLNFNTNDFLELMGLHTIKLCSNGAYPYDIRRVLETVFDPSTPARRADDVKKVFIAVDASTYTADTNTSKYPYPEYLYDHNPLNDIGYLLNKDVLLQYILRPLAEQEPTDLAMVYATTWQTEEYFNDLWVLRGYIPPEEVKDTVPADAFLERTERNLRENILPFVEDHPKTQFCFFFPPYSILYWDMVCRENHLDATMAQYEYIAESLLAYDNVQVFYFQNEEEMITDLNNYADYEHYRPQFNQFMTACFASGRDEIKPGQMRAGLDKMRDIIDRFDFDEVNSRYDFQRERTISQQ